MRSSRVRLGSGFTPLEDRTVPTIFGIPWADPDHLTISFVPDGTQTPLGASTLFQTLAAAGPVAAWEGQIVRAFQAWAAKTNINIGLVPDGGQPLGAVGAVQGDSRFGDIRVAAAPLSAGVVAEASPFSWTGTTYSGDVVLNANDLFAIGDQAGKYDLFSVAAHEAGHALGLDHSTAADSVMQEDYGFRTGLGASDVAAVQALYGPRAADTPGNNTPGTAAPLPAAGLGQFQADGVIATPSDVDYYKFAVPVGGAPLGVTVRLKASGLSLLTPSVTVTTASGQVVATAASTDPLNNDLTLTFTPGLFGGTYYVKVGSATADASGVGGYKLAANYLSLGVALTPLTNAVAVVAGGNTSGLLSAVLPLPPQHPADARFDAVYHGLVVASADINTYLVWTNKYAAGTTVGLNLMVWGLDVAPLSPRLRVYDASGLPVAFQVLADSTGLFSVQIPAAVAGASYYVQVSATTPLGPNSTGRYVLAVDFNRVAPVAFEGVGAGTVRAGAADAGTLTVPEAGLFQFALTAQSAVPSGGVTMTVYDAAGHAVLTLSAAAGQPPVTATQYLAAGTYVVRYAASAGWGGAGDVAYGLYLLPLSDGIGPYATSTGSGGAGGGSSTPPPASPPYTYTSSSTSSSASYGYTY